MTRVPVIPGGEGPQDDRQHRPRDGPSTPPQPHLPRGSHQFAVQDRGDVQWRHPRQGLNNGSRRHRPPHPSTTVRLNSMVRSRFGAALISRRSGRGILACLPSKGRGRWRGGWMTAWRPPTRCSTRPACRRTWNRGTGGWYAEDAGSGKPREERQGRRSRAPPGARRSGLRRDRNGRPGPGRAPCRRSGRAHRRDDGERSRRRDEAGGRRPPGRGDDANAAQGRDGATPVAADTNGSGPSPRAPGRSGLDRKPSAEMRVTDDPHRHDEDENQPAGHGARPG